MLLEAFDVDKYKRTIREEEREKNLGLIGKLLAQDRMKI